MALKPDSQKPMLPIALPNGHVHCADDVNCRKPGRLWFRGMEREERVCVEHAGARYSQGQTDDVPVKR